MAQWTFIDPNTLLPGDPWTSAKAQAAFENLEAVAEGAPGAPRVAGSALQFNIVAQATITTGVNAFAITDLEPHLGIMVWSDYQCTDQFNRASYEVSGNNGGSWTQLQEPITAARSSFIFSLGSGSRTRKLLINNTGVSSSDGGINVNAVRIIAGVSSDDTFTSGVLKVYGFWRGWD